MCIQRALPVYFFLAMSLSNPTFAWGPDGHQTVGAIADQLLAGSHAAGEVKTILNGLSLQEASVWADCAKGIDPGKGYTYPSPGKYKECGIFETSAGEAKMGDFVRRNDNNCSRKPTEETCHKQYHYTDVAIQRDRYERGLAGTRDDDLINATVAAVRVLQGGPSPAPFNLKDKREALLVLTHYVGDLHQPLHVGAVYLSPRGKLIDPDRDRFNENTDTQGGNRLLLTRTRTKLHVTWDEIPASLRAPSVDAALLGQARAIPPTKGQITDWPIQWAGDTLLAARQAFNGLKFGASRQGTWSVTLPADYNGRRSDVQKEQIIKAGAHLAELLRGVWP